MIFLLKGLLAGLIVSVPTGPISFLCVKRTLNDGLNSGIATGLGAVFADLIYSSIMIFGLVSVQSFFNINHGYIEKFGAIILIILGYLTYFHKRNKNYKIENKNSKTLLGKWFVSFVVTMTNPMQFILFGFVLTIFGVIGSTVNFSLLFLVGLLIGASFWWIGLSKFIYHIRERFKNQHIFWVNRIAGTVIFFSGMLMLINSFF